MGSFSFRISILISKVTLIEINFYLLLIEILKGVLGFWGFGHVVWRVAQQLKVSQGIKL